MTDLPSRSDLPDEHTWDLDRRYATAAAWRADAERAAEDCAALSASVADGLADGDDLLDAVRGYEDLAVRVEALLIHAERRRDVSAGDGHDERVQRARSLAADADAVERALADALAEWGANRLRRAIDATDGLARYRRYLRDCRAEAVAAGPAERVLADLDPVLSAPQEMHRRLLGDLSVEPAETTDGRLVRVASNYLALLRRPDRDLRRSAYCALHDALDGVANAAAAALDASVTADVREARLRGYDTAREHALDDHDVPVAVLDAVTSTVTDNLDHHHAHLERKRRRLGVDDLRVWDSYVSLTGADATFAYDDATRWLVDAVAPLGDDYRSRLAAGLDDRWVDAFPHAGKRPDAYNSTGYDTRPFVLLNYRGDASSAFRLAHELGHALHAEYASDAQPYVYSNPSPFLAEVASTVNEVLFFQHLRDHDDVGRTVADHFLETTRAKLYRHVMLTRCEDRFHDAVADGDPLVPDRLGSIYRDELDSFYAPVSFDDRTGVGWARIRQFFTPYAGYHYATGVGVAVAIADRLRRGDLAPDAYLDVLRAGSRRPPVDALADLGVDPRSPAVYEHAVSLYRDVLDQLAPA